MYILLGCGIASAGIGALFVLFAIVANQAYAAPEIIKCAIFNLIVSVFIFFVAKIKGLLEQKDNSYLFVEEIKKDANKVAGIIVTYVFVVVIACCIYINVSSDSRFEEGLNNYRNDSTSGYSSSNDYDYDKGYGYTEPKDGESLSDYIKRQDPELWEEMEENWNSMY